jgi:two-component system, cell cycle sensor histidine kinase and response regulator CckA
VNPSGQVYEISNSKFNHPTDQSESWRDGPNSPQFIRGAFRQQLVLIVEDDLTVQSANRSILESYGYRTLVADDGIDAIALYAEYSQEIAIVLMDMMMPNLDGVAAIQTLVKINPQVQVVAMSGIPSNQSAALTAGAKVFIAKPYTLETLMESLVDLGVESP